MYPWCIRIRILYKKLINPTGICFSRPTEENKTQLDDPIIFNNATMKENRTRLKKIRNFDLNCLNLNLIIFDGQIVLYKVKYDGNLV